MRIRPLEPRDRDSWLAARQRFMRGEPLRQHERDITDFIDTGSMRGLVAGVFIAESENGALAGFAEVTLRPYCDGCRTSPVGYLEAWWVDDAFRRQGIGKELIEACEAWAIKRGCAEMGSNCWSSNIVSQLAHRAAGYLSSDPTITFRKSIGPLTPQRLLDDWVALVPFAIRARSAAKFVSVARAGAIDMFLGITRSDTAHDGRKLDALEYEAYPEMALDQMKALAVDARARWPIVRMALLHRVGRVALAEPSVVIAVSTPHRSDAFAATRFLIDQLKASVAIWKKEIWSDGSRTWVSPDHGTSTIFP